MSEKSVRPFERRFLENRRVFQEWVPVIEKIQAGLRDDVDVLGDQEGWEKDVMGGMKAWVGDRGNVFRFLKKNGFDEDKAYSALLSAVPNRVKYGLHLPIPSIAPYSDSPLFYILPLPRFADRLGRPIAIFTPRNVVRDREGKLEDLVEWVWWASEMVRRTLKDYWGGRRWGGEGMGGEGMIVIIDAAGAGYRNIEVELFPKLGEIGSKNFPGMINDAFVVNAGWTQRGLWKVIEKVIPTSASEKIKFIDTSNAMEEYIDLDRLPSVYGGRCDWTFSPNDNTILQYYQQHPIASESRPQLDLRTSDSVTSVDDVFYSARPTPVADTSSHTVDASYCTHDTTQRHHVSSSRQASDRPLSISSSSSSSLASSTSSLRHETALSTIKSLTDFRLYLSPSRRARIELPRDTLPITPIIPRITATRPAIYQRRSRAPLRALGYSPTGARSYSHDLQKHHARGLSNLDSNFIPSTIRTRAVSPIPKTPSGESTASSSSVSASSNSTQPTVPPTPTLLPLPDQTIKTISAYSRSKNPFYGYPAIMVTSNTDPHHTSLQPAFHRRRKRDLVKVLVWLLMLRFQSLRNKFERILGLGGVSGTETEKGLNPGEGLMGSYAAGMHRRSAVQNGDWRRRRDWLWMVVGLLLTRGSWMGWAETGVQVLGMAGWGEVFGLT